MLILEALGGSKPYVTMKIFHTVMWTFQCLNHLTPPYLDDMFVSTFKLHHYLTRQTTGIHLPNPRTNALKRSFGYMRATVWNPLPKYMQSLGIIF